MSNQRDSIVVQKSFNIPNSGFENCQKNNFVFQCMPENSRKFSTLLVVSRNTLDPSPSQNHLRSQFFVVISTENNIKSLGAYCYFQMYFYAVRKIKRTMKRKKNYFNDGILIRFEISETIVWLMPNFGNPKISDTARLIDFWRQKILHYTGGPKKKRFLLFHR